MASVMQTLFSLSAFQQRYLPTATAHWEVCQEPLPASCIDCQMHKLADGLLSGRYSHPRPHAATSPSAPKETNPLAHDSPTPVFQEGVRPSTFKALVGRGHDEFSTMRQQDAEEFFGFFMDTLEEELLSLLDSDQTKKSAPVEPSVANDDGWVEVGKKNKQVVTRSVRSFVIIPQIPRH